MEVSSRIVGNRFIQQVEHVVFRSIAVTPSLHNSTCEDSKQRRKICEALWLRYLGYLFLSALCALLAMSLTQKGSGDPVTLLTCANGPGCVSTGYCQHRRRVRGLWYADNTPVALHGALFKRSDIRLSHRGQLRGTVNAYGFTRATRCAYVLSAFYKILSMDCGIFNESESKLYTSQSLSPTMPFVMPLYVNVDGVGLRRVCGTDLCM